MKVSALAPQFIVESPAPAEAETAAGKLGHLRLIRPVEDVPPSDDSLQEETRKGQHRLMRLVRKPARTEEAEPVEASGPKPGAPSFSNEFKKRQALAIYQDIANGRDSSTHVGRQIDILY